MGKKKTKTVSTAQHQYMTPPATADVNALREMKATTNPSIPYQYAKAREQYANTWNNPLGAHSSAASRDAAHRVTNRAFAQDESQANAASQYDADNANFQRQAVISGFTQPQLVQTGGTQNTTQSGGFWSNLLMSGIGAGANVGAAAMM